jgi:hypothetical protein
MKRRAHTRRGAALIIALVILAAMLMLGLPFLFTQSSSLAGTRSFTHNQQARLSADTAENAGIDIVGTAMSFHFANTGPTPLPAMPAPAEEYTSLYWSLRGGEYDKLPHFDPATQTGTTALPPSANHVHLDLRQIGPINAAGALDPVHNPSFPDLIQPGLAPGTTPHPQGAVSTLGLAVEDEGGKLDPNYMDAVSWMNLLAAERIADAAAVSGQQGPGGLALALAQLHNPPNSAYPGLGHITYLEQLLSAVPAANTRLGLTRTELELLRPLLSFSNRAQGRAGPRLPDLVAGGSTPYVMSGPLMPGNPPAHPVAAETLTLIDLGTLLNVSGSVLHVDSVAPARLLANAVTPALTGAGTVLVVEDKGATDGSGNRLQIEHVLPNNQATIASAAISADMPVGIAAPPGINVLQAAPAVQQVLDAFITVPPAAPAPPLPTPAPDSMGGANGLAMGAFQCTLPPISPATGAAQQNAFALLNPLYSAVVLGTGTALPTSSADITLPTGAPTLPGNGVSYAAAADQNSQLRPVLLAGAWVIDVQVAALTSLPPSGWAVLSGGVRADMTGIAANPEFIYYTALTINPATPGLGTLSIAGRGLTWANTPSTAIAVFCDPSPKLAGVPSSPPVTVTFFAPHELPPLQVASHGVVTVESSATITDPSGRQVAQRSRRVTAQALPQESLLEDRWLTQAQLHALLASRQGSLMTSFPRPYPRLSDMLPSDADPAATLTYPDRAVGMRPATLRTLQTSVFVDHTWTLPLSGTSQTCFTAMLNAVANTTQSLTGVAAAAVAGATNAHAIALSQSAPQNTVTPEGLLCTALNPSVYLAFPVKAPDGGPFGIPGAVVTAPTSSRNVEIPARQFGFWIKPSQVWTGIVPLLEMRMPVANTGLPLSGTLLPQAAPAIDGRWPQGGTPPAGPDTSLQNYLALSYDGSVAGQEQLVLRFANGAIEHRVPYGPQVPAYDPTQPHLDTRSAGGSGTVLAPPRPWNDIEYRYLYTLKPDCWHLVQVTYLRDTPGSQAITVDGLSGQDITRNGTLTMVNQGDHLTLPCLVLGASLPAIPLPASIATATAATTMAVATLPVSCWLPQDPAQPGVTRGADQLLPARGYVRIGDEYLSYEGISATVVTGGVATNTLQQVRRGQRQNTVAAGALAFQAWPTMPAHAPGDLVVPGGYRIANGGGSPLLSGGCTLAPLDPSQPTGAGFWSGDAHNSYLLWGTLMPSNTGDDTTPGLPSSATPIVDVISSGPPVVSYNVLLMAPKRINMTPTSPAETWPIRGFAKVVNLGNSSNPNLAALSGPDGSTQANGLFNGLVFYYDNAPAGGPAQPPPGAMQPFLNVVTTVYTPGAVGGWPIIGIPAKPWIDLVPGSAYAVVMISCEIDAPASTPLAALSPGTMSLGWSGAGSYIAGAPNLPTFSIGPTGMTYPVTIIDGVWINTPPAAPTPSAPGTSLIQFYNQANNGDVEWMTYHWLTPGPQVAGGPPTYPFPNAAGQYFLVNFNGFPWYGADVAGNMRGMERTHGPLDPSSTSPVVEIYPAGTRVLPVQSSGLGVVRTGDVVTIAPAVCQPAAPPASSYTYGSGLTTPAGCWQAVVRYAPTDGFGSSGGATPVLTDDTHNNYYAFSEALPTAFAVSSFDLLCWPCWNANDLSPMVWGPPGVSGMPPSPLPSNYYPLPITGVTSLMPWSNAFATGFLQPGSTDDRVTYIGASDDRVGHNPAGTLIMEGEIDALHGGIPPSLAGQGSIPLPIVVGAIISAGGTATPTSGQPWSTDASGNLIAPSTTPWLAAATALSASAPLTIQAYQANQTPAALIPSSTGYGLAQIGGEIVAYRRNVDASGNMTGNLDLIGRGLLGSLPCAHSGAETMLFPPIGPVWLLGGALAQGFEGAVPLAPVPGTPTPAQLPLDAPAFLVSSLDGLSMELIAAPDGFTAPWLRGLYGTCPPDLAGSGTAWNGALVIAWWPRYPSALPNANTKPWTALTAVQQAAMLRSRTYAWAGFPLRFYDAWFSSSDDLGYVTLLDDAKILQGPPAQASYGGYGDPTFDVFARALAAGFDWVQTDNTSTPVNLPEIPFPASVAASGAIQPAGTEIAAAFASPQFAPGGAVAKVDGAELRVLWRYHAATTPLDMVGMANLCNRAPTLGQAKLRCRAPAKIVGVESAR